MEYNYYFDTEEQREWEDHQEDSAWEKEEQEKWEKECRLTEASIAAL